MGTLPECENKSANYLFWAHKLPHNILTEFVLFWPVHIKDYFQNLFYDYG
jgi:hypothetical protein